MRWGLSPEAEATYLRFVADLAQGGGAASGAEAGLLNSLPMMVLKLLVLLRLGTDGGAARTDLLDNREMHSAIAVALRVACASARALQQPAGDSCWSGYDDRVVFEMVAKLRVRGPLRQRDLFRTYHDQRTERLLPVLERGLAIGIIQNQDGLLVASGLARSD